MKKKYHDFLFKSLRHRLVLMAGILWLTTLSVVAQQAKWIAHGECTFFDVATNHGAHADAGIRADCHVF